MANLQLVYAPNNSQLYVLPVPEKFARDPSTSDNKYTPGQLWYNTATTAIWIYKTAGSWVKIVGATGDVNTVTGTANQITATNTLGDVVLTIPAAFTAPGSIASTTSITATLGNITATNGNLVLSTAGNKLVINAATPASSSVGTTGAMVAGAVTITSSAITASSLIIYSRRTLGTAMGSVSITAQVGGSATLTSDDATETSTFDYLIIN